MRNPGHASCSWPGSRTERPLSTTDRTWTEGLRSSPSHICCEAERIDAGARWTEVLRPTSRVQRRGGWGDYGQKAADGVFPGGCLGLLRLPCRGAGQQEDIEN